MARYSTDATPATPDSLCHELQMAVNETCASHPHCLEVISEYRERILNQIDEVQEDVIKGRKLDEIRWEIHRLSDRAVGVTERRRRIGNHYFPQERHTSLFD